MTNGANRVINVHRHRGGACRIPIREVAFQISVGKVRTSRKIEPERDRRNDVTSALTAIEDAPAISEAALAMRKGHKAHRLKIEGSNPDQSARHLLTISAHILHRCSPNRARYPGKTFDAADSLLADMQHEGIPIGSCCGDEVSEAAVGGGGCNRVNRIVNGDMNHQPIKAVIAHQQIAASAQNKDPELPLAGKLDSFDQLCLARHLAKIARRTADAEGGIRSERNLLLNADRKSRHGLESTTPRPHTGARGGETVQSREAAIEGRPREMLMYPEIMVIPMREELTRAGLSEARTAADVDTAVAQPGTTMVVVNSICGCAAGKMRPGVRLAMQHNAKPDHAVTVFAGQDREATEKARSYFGGHPPTSPAIAILRDGQLVYLMQRSAIETSTAPAIAQELTRAFDTYCAKTTA